MPKAPCRSSKFSKSFSYGGIRAWLSPTADVDASMLVAEWNDIEIMAGILNDDHDASPSLTTAVRAAGAAGEAGKPLSNGSIHGEGKRIISTGLGPTPAPQ